METDYHSSSYQVEEMKANEGKMMKQISDLEKQKQELNELRLRDLDMQISLQDRWAHRADQYSLATIFYSN